MAGPRSLGLGLQGLTPSFSSAIPLIVIQIGYFLRIVLEDVPHIA